jgi:hypothetical protein
MSTSKNPMVSSAPAGRPPADFAPSFRAHLTEQLEPIRACLEDRKAEVCAKLEEMKRELQAQSNYAMSSLPPNLRATKVKDYNAQHGCNLYKLLEAVAVAVLAEHASQWKPLGDESEEDQCPPTIVRGAGGVQPTRGTSAFTGPTAAVAAAATAASLSHLSDPTSAFQTPTISRDHRPQGSIWSTNTKKKKYVTINDRNHEQGTSERISVPYSCDLTPSVVSMIKNVKRENWRR